MDEEKSKLLLLVKSIIEPFGHVFDFLDLFKNHSFREHVKKVIINYGSTSILMGVVVSHFGGRGAKNKSPTALQSAIRALSSRSLFGTMILSSFLSYALQRYSNFSKRYTLPTFFLSLWGLIYKYRVVERPKVWYQRTYFNTSVVEKSALSTDWYSPIPWAFNRHGQTITCFALSNLEWIFADPIIYSREEIPAYDPPNVQFLDWASLKEEAKHSMKHTSGAKAWDQPIVFMIHGLGDDRNHPYIKRCARMCLNRGYRVVVWSYWRFDFEDSRDLHLAIEHVHKSFPNAPLIAFAWSAGAYPLMRYLQKIKSDTPLIAAVSQSGCLDFPQAIIDVFTNENTTYGAFLLLQEKICIWRHLENDKHLSKEKISEILALTRTEFDAQRLYDRFLDAISPKSDEHDSRNPPWNLAFLGHAKGLKDLPDYKDRIATASHYSHKAIDFMDEISITTLLLHAEDDPVVSSEHVDWAKMQENRNIIVGHTHRGGHCSWYEGILPFGTTFGDRMGISFVSSLLETHAQTHFLMSLLQTSLLEYDRSRVNAVQQGALRTMARITSASDLSSYGSTNGRDSPKTSLPAPPQRIGVANNGSRISGY